MTGRPERYLVDSNIFDKIEATPGALDLVRRLTDGRKIELVTTHIQEDEIAGIADAERRERIDEIPRTDVPTYGFVLDVSRLGMARLGEEAPIETIRSGNWAKYTKDALIAATSQFDGLTLVTEDKRLANVARRELKVDVWDWPHLWTHLQKL